MAANQILTATFQLGNSSGVRKRVTVILHDSDFCDLSACTFWLAAGPGRSRRTPTGRSPRGLDQRDALGLSGDGRRRRSGSGSTT